MRPGDPSRASASTRRRGRSALGRPRGPGPVHPARLVAEHAEVAVHEADDRDHDPWQPELPERVDQVVERRRERQEQRRLDADPALEGDGRELPSPSPLIVSVERPEVDRAERVARTGEDERQRREHERQREERAREPCRAVRDAPTDDRPTTTSQATTERDERPDRQQADREDERDRQEELQARIGAVERALRAT